MNSNHSRPVLLLVAASLTASVPPPVTSGMSAASASEAPAPPPPVLPNTAALTLGAGAGSANSSGLAAQGISAAPAKGESPAALQPAAAGVIARDLLKKDVVVNRVLNGQTYVNGVLNVAVTDNMVDPRTLRAGAVPAGVAAAAKFAPRGLPIHEVNNVVDLRRPMVVWIDPAQPADVLIGSVIREAAAPDAATPVPGPTSVFGGVILPRDAHPAAVNTWVSVPNVAFGASPAPLRPQSQLPSQLRLQSSPSESLSQSQRASQSSSTSPSKPTRILP